MPWPHQPRTDAMSEDEALTDPHLYNQNDF
jgi:hypothetical protein